MRTFKKHIKMKSFKLYNVLKRIPGISDSEVQEAVKEVPSKDDVATKEDIARIETKIARIETKVEQTAKQTIMWMFGLAIAIIIAVFLK